MSKPKDLYIGTFQTRKRVFTERAYAWSEKQMWLLCCRRIAKRQNIPLKAVFDWFENTDNYTIRKEVEFKEEE